VTPRPLKVCDQLPWWREYRKGKKDSRTALLTKPTISSVGLPLQPGAKQCPGGVRAESRAPPIYPSIAETMRRACYSLVAASNAPAALDPTAVATDSLLRVNKPEQTIAPEVRQEVTRILVRSGKNGEVSQDDRTYLASVVSANTGLSQQDAEKRVSGAINTMKEALDRARRIGILLGFAACAK
jgi:hypothetical protein